MLSDLRFALRQCVKSPGFTAAAVLMLALGLGACVSVLTVLHAVVVRDLPYHEPGTLVRVWDTNARRNLTSFPASIPNFLSWQASSRTLTFAAWRYASATIGGGAPAERLQVTRVSSNLLALLGLRPAAGRGFLPAEDQPNRDRVVLLSRRVWQDRFGASEDAIGREVLLDGEPHTIVGIAPRELESLVPGDVWKPLAPDPSRNPRGQHYLRVIGRLQPGSGIAEAQAEMTAVALNLARDFPDSNANWSVRLESFRDWIVPPGARVALAVLSVATGCLLLIACANVGNLLLVRAVRRHRELCLRAALGASRWRIFRQVLAENGILTLFGGSLGITLASCALRLLRVLRPENLPRLDEIGFDVSTVALALGLSLLTGLAVSLVSLVAAGRLDLQQSLKQSGRGTGAEPHTLQRSLVAIQLALSLMLIIGAALLEQSFAHLLGNDLGFRPDHLLTFQVAPPESRYPKPAALRFYERLTDAVKPLPGVAQVGLTSSPPFCPETFRFNTRFSTRQSAIFPPSELLSGEFSHIDAGYFPVLGATLTHGRTVTAADLEEAPDVVVLNEAAARAFWPDGDAVGKTVFWGEPLKVVGVVRDVRNIRRDLPARPALYLSMRQQLWSTMTVVVRYDGDLRGLLAAIRREVGGLDPQVPIFNVRTMDDTLAGASAQAESSAWLLGAFAVTSLTLAVLGLYGVVSCHVAERTHEFGVRLALGAQPADVLRLVVRQNMMTQAAGLLGGTGAALLGSKVLSSMLYGIQPTDAATFIAATTLLGVISLSTAAIAARRATRVDPMEALRAE